MKGAHVRTGEAKDLDFGSLVILIRIDVDFVLRVLFPVLLKNNENTKYALE